MTSILLLFVLILLVIVSAQRDKLKKISYENNKKTDIIELYKQQTKVLEEMLEKIEKEATERVEELKRHNNQLSIKNKNLSMAYFRMKQEKIKK